MPKNGVLILECLDKADPGSEGLFLAHMLSLMEVDHQYVEVKTKYQLVALMKKSPYKLVHITTHGSVRNREKKEQFKGLWLKNGTLTVEDLNELKNTLKGCSVVCTACLSGNSNFAEEFARITGCEHYIAPSGSPRFYNAIFFAHIFYHKHFIIKKSIENIVSEYDSNYKNPHSFVLISLKDFIDKTFE